MPNRPGAETSSRMPYRSNVENSGLDGPAFVIIIPGDGYVSRAFCKTFSFGIIVNYSHFPGKSY